MWLKLCLLLIYVTALFIIARLIEAVTWYETGSLSRRLLDPMTLSVMKLKALLHQRGVTYDSVVEKSDLTQLVEGTGPAMEDEVELSLSEESATDETVFESGAHFYEQVEDAKDSVWMIFVSMGETSNLRFISDQTWKSIKKRILRFGVRAGVMDCTRYQRYCNAKGLTSPQLLLALPQDFKTKASVKMHTYTGSPRESAINNWIHNKLDEKINTINSYKEFKYDWLKYKHNFLDPEIRTVLFTKEGVMPMFYSALSLRFPGRVRFGKADMKNSLKDEFSSYFKNNSKTSGPLPHYLIITPEDKFLYGIQRGEYLTFESLEIFLKSLYPSLNDLFILSFVIVNVMSWFEFFEVQGTFFKRLRKLLWCAIKYNVLLIMMWLPLVGLFSLPYFEKLIMIGLKFVRFISTSSFASLVRKDFLFYTKHVFSLTSSFLMYALIIGFVQYRKSDNSTDVDSSEEDDLWNFNQMRTLEHLIRPADSIGQLEAGFGRFGTISSPTLWLRPSGSVDYIQQLPTWKFQVSKFPPTESQKLNSPEVLNTGRMAGKTIEEIGSIGIHNIERMKEEIQCDEKLMADICSNSCFPTGYLPNTQCVICLDDYMHGIILCGLPCRHSFHEQCILSWLNRDNHFCPVCRWPADQPKNVTLHLHCE
ncbi:hypothetical protein SNE40_008051 [Patella caerulea]|uniref:RING-type domain-containing protein n=2 Tax=Patella caerulea TaxID=87958 RepID=A0AAN8K0J3_PATCE